MVAERVENGCTDLERTGEQPRVAPPPYDLAVLASRLRGFGTTIFAEMSALAERTGAINLGQGFPDVDGPDVVKNQYPPGAGVRELRVAVAEHQRRWYGLEYDAEDEVLVTTGATEAIAAALLALCEPGDEVVTFEPYYDSYAASIAMAGAERRVVTLRPPGYSFDRAALASAIGPRTRLLLLNSPHNPTGKVFGVGELEQVAQLCIENDLLAVTDEVYEHLVFDGEHRPLASVPGMRDRTVTISSGGKTFSFTGWKVGWVCASAPLVNAVRTAKQYLTYVNGAPFQLAIATGLGLPDAYFRGLADDLRVKRDLLVDGLRAGRFRPRGPTSSPRTSVPSASPTAWPSAGSCPSVAVSSRCRTSCSTTITTLAGRSCGSRSASGPRSSRRP
jgi:N-succinyldiaminopimelate aminotransferase